MGLVVVGLAALVRTVPAGVARLPGGTEVSEWVICRDVGPESKLSGGGWSAWNEVTAFDRSSSCESVETALEAPDENGEMKAFYTYLGHHGTNVVTSTIESAR